MAEEIRKFETGATRDTDTTKPDFDGFLSPLVIARYGEYMHKHRVQKDGTLRASDNWTKGIPFSAYMKSGWRHFFAWWGYDRGVRPSAREGMVEEALLGLLFNVSGYLHEVLKARRYEPELEWDTARGGILITDTGPQPCVYCSGTTGNHERLCTQVLNERKAK